MNTACQPGPLRLWLVAVTVAMVPGTGFAQPDQSELWNMSVVEVHHDMMQEFEQLQKEASAAYKKIGVKQRLVSQVNHGQNAVYIFMTPVAKFAEYDESSLLQQGLGEAAAARWVARATKCVKSRRTSTIRTRADLSIPLKEERTPKIAVWVTLRHLPGRYPEYNDWLSNEWVPAMKEAGMNGVYYYRNAFGGSSREWGTFVLVDEWAGFDRPHPIRRELGEDKWNALQGTGGPMTTDPHMSVLLLRRDLGIPPDSATSSQ